MSTAEIYLGLYYAALVMRPQLLFRPLAGGGVINSHYGVQVQTIMLNYISHFEA